VSHQDASRSLPALAHYRGQKLLARIDDIEDTQVSCYNWLYIFQRIVTHIIASEEDKGAV
jgi:hypothetical protein